MMRPWINCRTSGSDLPGNASRLALRIGNPSDVSTTGDWQHAEL